MRKSISSEKDPNRSELRQEGESERDSSNDGSVERRSGGSSGAPPWAGEEAEPPRQFYVCTGHVRQRQALHSSNDNVDCLYGINVAQYVPSSTRVAAVVAGEGDYATDVKVPSLHAFIKKEVGNGDLEMCPPKCLPPRPPACPGTPMLSKYQNISCSHPKQGLLKPESEVVREASFTSQDSSQSSNQPPAPTIKPAVTPSPKSKASTKQSEHTSKLPPATPVPTVTPASPAASVTPASPRQPSRPTESTPSLPSSRQSKHSSKKSNRVKQEPEELPNEAPPDNFSIVSKPRSRSTVKSRSTISQPELPPKDHFSERSHLGLAPPTETLFCWHPNKSVMVLCWLLHGLRAAAAAALYLAALAALLTFMCLSCTATRTVICFDLFLLTLHACDLWCYHLDDGDFNDNHLDDQDAAASVVSSNVFPPTRTPKNTLAGSLAEEGEGEAMTYSGRQSQKSWHSSHSSRRHLADNEHSTIGSSARKKIRDQSKMTEVTVYPVASSSNNSHGESHLQYQQQQQYEPYSEHRSRQTLAAETDISRRTKYNKQNKIDFMT